MLRLSEGPTGERPHAGFFKPGDRYEMKASRHTSLTRRVLSGLAALSVAAVGLTFASAPAHASGDSVNVTASVSGGTAYVGQVTTVNFNLVNNAHSDDFHKFTVVLPPTVSAPPGKTAPVPLGVTGAGNWGESIVPCGTVPNCSWLLIVKALMPRWSSRVAPGATITASVSLVPNTAGTVTFPVIHVEDDMFAVLGTPSINVVNQLPGSFCVSNPGTLTAGASVNFTVQAIALGTETTAGVPCTGKPVGYAGKPVEIKFASDEGSGAAHIVPVAPVSPGDGAAGVSTQTTASDIVFNFGPSTTGKYTFTGTFDVAAPQQAIVAAEVSPGTVAGSSGDFLVNPGPATKLVINSIVDDASQSATKLTAGAVFDAYFNAFDTFGNVTPTPTGGVSISAGGTGTFTSAGAFAVSSASDIATAGEVSGYYSPAQTGVPITLTLAAPLVVSAPTNVDFAGTAVGSATLIPGVAASVITPGYVAPNPDGTPNCALTDPKTGAVLNPACVSTSLSKGANGLVTLNTTDCATAGAGTVGLCGSTTPAVVANLTANFSPIDALTGLKTELYTAALPASLTYVCASAICPVTTNPDGDTTIYNSVEEQVEAFQNFPLYAQDASDGPSAPFYQVPACQTITGGVEGGYTLGAIGPVPGPHKSCVDVSSIFRSPTSGDVSFKVLYFDDYKLVP